MITGNTFSFEEAQEFGIINDIFERDGFMDNIMEYARQFTPPNKAAKAGRPHQARRADGWEIPMESALRGAREPADPFPKVTMPKRVSPHTWRSGQQYLRRNRMTARRDRITLFRG